MDKRRRQAEMVALTIAMLVSHHTTTKGGGLQLFTFSIYALPFEIWSQTWGASIHWERNKYDCFNNFIEMIREIALLTRQSNAVSFSRWILRHDLMFFKVCRLWLRVQHGRVSTLCDWPERWCWRLSALEFECWGVPWRVSVEVRVGFAADVERLQKGPGWQVLSGKCGLISNLKNDSHLLI